mmetsp:Transcript_130353/g.193975  ORF Transcript_130353/g.193975 Transcript_130353/m.193975 type:complete len:313 (-) Transcript_130353:330-1268(-)
MPQPHAFKWGRFQDRYSGYESRTSKLGEVCGQSVLQRMLHTVRNAWHIRSARTTVWARLRLRRELDRPREFQGADFSNRCSTIEPGGFAGFDAEPCCDSDSAAVPGGAVRGGRVGSRSDKGRPGPAASLRGAFSQRHWPQPALPVVQGRAAHPRCHWQELTPARPGPVPRVHFVPADQRVWPGPPVHPGPPAAQPRAGSAQVRRARQLESGPGRARRGCERGADGAGSCGCQAVQAAVCLREGAQREPCRARVGSVRVRQGVLRPDVAGHKRRQRRRAELGAGLRGRRRGRLARDPWPRHAAERHGRQSDVT